MASTKGPILDGSKDKKQASVDSGTTSQPLSFSYGFSLFQPSIEILKKNIETSIALIVVPSLLITLGTLLTERTDLSEGLKGLAVLIVVVGFILTIISALATTYFELRAVEDKRPGILESCRSIGTFGLRLFGLGLLVGATVLVGFILLIIPGFIMIRRYFLAQYFLVDEDLGIRESMDRSAAATKPISSAVYGILLVTILVGAFSASVSNAVMPVGAIVGAFIGLLYAFAPALFYVHLKKQSSLAAPLPPKA